MLSSPYPSPPLWPWTLAMILGGLQGLGAGLWVIVSPPQSYEGIGAVLTTTWGILLVAGSVLILVAQLLRVHQLEIPGIVFALGGVVLYVYLSWEQTLTTSPGSGPRALFLGQLACSFYLSRLILLLVLDLRARRRIDARGADDG